MKKTNSGMLKFFILIVLGLLAGCSASNGKDALLNLEHPLSLCTKHLPEVAVATGSHIIGDMLLACALA